MRLSDDYWNDPHSQEVRREVLKNDRDCLMTRAQADADLLNQGRFAKEVATQVTGGGSVPSYPQIPSGPWGGSNPVPPDPATDQLGYDINEVEPVERPTPDPETESNLPVAVDRGSQEGEGDHSPASPSTNSDAAAASFEVPLGDAVSAKGGSRLAPSPASSRKSFHRRF
jgi:hypothetical protein